MIHAQKKIKNLEAQISLYVANVARLKAEIEALKAKTGENPDANA
jgi:prefoldin subunit 5